MKMHNFTQFIQAIQINENSDLGWSDKNWTERDTEGVNPPNSGLEGSSAEPMDYNAGDYGETGDEDILLDEPETKTTTEDLENIKALIDDLTTRIVNIEKNKKPK